MQRCVSWSWFVWVTNANTIPAHRLNVKKFQSPLLRPWQWMKSQNFLQNKTKLSLQYYSSIITWYFNRTQRKQCPNDNRYCKRQKTKFFLSGTGLKNIPNKLILGKDLGKMLNSSLGPSLTKAHISVNSAKKSTFKSQKLTVHFHSILEQYFMW